MNGKDGSYGKKCKEWCTCKRHQPQSEERRAKISAYSKRERPQTRLTDEARLERAKKRFWEKVEKTETCWIWTGSTVEFGYGQFFFKRGMHPWAAHRVSWFLEYGVPPEDSLVVRHLCNNPPCVRPDHLAIGTQADNVQDTVDSGRLYTILTEEEVIMIRSTPEITGAEIARQLGVDPQVVNNARKGKTWKHVV